MKLALLFSGSLAFVAVAPGCGGLGGTQSCTLIGCGYAGSYAADVPAGVDEVAVKVCRNADCGSATVSLAAGHEGAQIDASSADVYLTTQAGGARLSVQFLQVYAPKKMADGDVYSVEVTNAGTGDVIAQESQAVAYALSYPNGPDCDPEPCRSVSSGPFVPKP